MRILFVILWLAMLGCVFTARFHAELADGINCRGSRFRHQPTWMSKDAERRRCWTNCGRDYRNQPETFNKKLDAAAPRKSGNGCWKDQLILHEFVNGRLQTCPRASLMSMCKPRVRERFGTRARR